MEETNLKNIVSFKKVWQYYTKSGDMEYKEKKSGESHKIDRRGSW